MLNTLVSNNIISKFQMANSLKDFMEKDVISIQFTEIQMNRLKYEEEMEILEVYKKRGKQEPSFGGNDTDLGGGGGFDNIDFGGDDDLDGDDLDGGDTGGSESLDLGGGTEEDVSS